MKKLLLLFFSISFMVFSSNNEEKLSSNILTSQQVNEYKSLFNKYELKCKRMFSFEEVLEFIENIQKEKLTNFYLGLSDLYEILNNLAINIKSSSSLEDKNKFLGFINYMENIDIIGEFDQVKHGLDLQITKDLLKIDNEELINKLSVKETSSEIISFFLENEGIFDYNFYEIKYDGIVIDVAIMLKESNENILIIPGESSKFSFCGSENILKTFLIEKFKEEGKEASVFLLEDIFE